MCGSNLEVIPGMNPDRRIIWAIEVMQRRLGDGITIDELAQSVSLSRSRFASLFREQIGVPPGRYLRDFRLDRARLLLETTPLSVREVMAAVGFNDPSHFSRDFDRAFGVSPRDWRKRTSSPSGLDSATPATRWHDRPTLRADLAGTRRLSSKD